jgi:hypothetical protein
MQTLVKCMLTIVGARTSPRTIHNLNAAISYLETGRWLSANGFHPQSRVAEKSELFDLIISRVGNRLLLYLEFGVFQGESMRYWSTHVKNPNAALHGFDSFEGLPEEWNIDSPKGLFSTDGKIPDIPDSRVKFHKGWFEKTLAQYVPPEHAVLVVNMDADLYSSTRYVLAVLRPRLSIGSFLYFDEFADRSNELKAFAEFVEESKFKFELLGATKTLSQAVFMRIA